MQTFEHPNENATDGVNYFTGFTSGKILTDMRKNGNNFRF
jgi:hypothetical protein